MTSTPDQALPTAEQMSDPDPAPAPAENTAPASFRRGPAFVFALLCSLVGLFVILFFPLCYSAPVPGTDGQRYVFSTSFFAGVTILGLCGAVNLLIGVWRRTITLAWWTYPLLLVLFCILYIVLLIICNIANFGMEIANATPAP